MNLFLILVISALPASVAWWGFHAGNDFLLYLFGLISFAPLTAFVAMKTKLF